MGEWLIAGAVTLVALALGMVWGHRLVARGQRRGSGIADALGNFIDVFDGSRARADEALKSRKHEGSVIPSPDLDERSMSIDLRGGRVVVREPRPH